MHLRPETSLVPGVLSLSSFFIENFPHVFWYPYWYLGNPYSYLIGPVVPVILFLLTKASPSSLHYLYFGTIIASMLIGGIGVYLFLKDWEDEDQRSPLRPAFAKATSGKQGFAGQAKSRDVVAFISGIFYVLLPFSWIGLYYQNGLKVIAFAVVPYLFIVYRRFLKKSLLGYYFLLIFLIALCLLITVNILLTLIIGVVAIYIAEERLLRHSPSSWSRNDIGDGMQGARWKWRGEKIAQTVVIFCLGIFLATFWYTQRFWVVLLTNPSFGGVPLWNIIVNLFQFLLNFFPLVLAILVVKGRIKSRRLFFAFLFTLSFLFLTGARFLADHDFVVDWIGFLPELQFGISILGGVLIGRLIRYATNSPYVNICHSERSDSEVEESHSTKPPSGMRSLHSSADSVGMTMCKVSYLYKGLLLISGVVSVFVSSALIVNLLFYSKSDYQTDIVGILESHVKDKDARVFLSGSDVFWINNFLPLKQVRGANDGVSINPYWAHGAYQIREGESRLLTEYWLRIFGSSYLLLHQPDSIDPFHDFIHPEKFQYMQLLADKSGDKLYEIPNVSEARVVDKKILTIGKPKNGADEEQLESYAGTFKRSIRLRYLYADTILIKGNISSSEVINLAVSYSKDWKLKAGRGRLVIDALGNIVIVPASPGEREFVIAYERGVDDQLILIVLFVLGSVFLLKFEYLYPRIKRRIPKIHLGVGEDEEY